MLEEIDQSLARKKAMYSLAAVEGHKIIDDLRSAHPKFPRVTNTPVKVDKGLTIKYTNG